jgi:hypothetical protein
MPGLGAGVGARAAVKPSVAERLYAGQLGSTQKQEYGRQNIVAGRTLMLERSLPDEAIPEALQQVQSQWPGARVELVAAQRQAGSAEGRVPQTMGKMSPLRPHSDALRYKMWLGTEAVSQPSAVISQGPASIDEEKSRQSVPEPGAPSDSLSVARKSAAPPGSAPSEASSSAGPLAFTRQGADRPVSVPGSIADQDGVPPARPPAEQAIRRPPNMPAQWSANFAAAPARGVAPVAGSAPASAPSEQQGLILFYVHLAEPASQSSEAATPGSTQSTAPGSPVTSQP